jgi:hypothetical protein
MHTTFRLENMNGTENLENRGVDEKIRLKWISKE